jgi:transcriptional regulator with XRE-family HTH domain
MTHPLAQWRKDNELSQEAFAKQIGVKRTTVARWETGTRKIDQARLSKISKKTGIPARQLRPDLAKFFEAAE